MKFEEILVYLKQGKKIRERLWDKEISIQVRDRNLVLLRHDVVLQHVSFRMTDLYSEDWEILE